MAPFSHDLLARSRPRRLRCRGGDWELELERFDRMSGALYRPKHLAVIGPAAIREALTSLTSSHAFCEAVERVMAEAHDSDVIYEVAGEGLRVVSAMEERVSSIESAKRLVAAELEVAQLRARVARLEQAFAGLRRGGFAPSGAHGSAPHPQPSAPPRGRDDGAHPAASAPGPNPGAANSGAANSGAANEASPAAPSPMASNPPSDSASASDASPLGGAPAEEENADPQPVGSEAAGASPPESAASDEPEVEPAAAIPSSGDLSRILEGLLGAPVPLTEAEAPLSIDGSCYGCMLLDDDDQIVGAFVADLKATVMLGGTLMMIPDNVLEECLEAGEPTEDMLEAMSEVLNVSSRAFNDVPGNPHVRTEVLALLDLEAHPWLPNPVARTDHAEPNGGTLSMVVCAKPQ
ncbi:MAG: hypothetical protein AB8I08_04595 [Sandaracinaceae bacterium]